MNILTRTIHLEAEVPIATPDPKFNYGDKVVYLFGSYVDAEIVGIEYRKVSPEKYSWLYALQFNCKGNTDIQMESEKTILEWVKEAKKIANLPIFSNKK
ncbi:MAG: hypothetical protein AB4290_07505 [Spirulina sp.]